MNYPVLPSNPTLPQYQNYVKSIGEVRGWHTTSDLELFLLFSEEVGELAKAIRNHRQLFTEKPHAKDPHTALQEEFADVFSYLLDLANHFGIDLETAFRHKEAINANRHWHNE